MVINGQEETLKLSFIRKLNLSWFYITSSCFALVGCQGSTDISDSLGAYVKDLNRYEQLSMTTPAKRFPTYALPSYKLKQQSLTQFDIGLIDFLSLQHCDLGVLVGEKNSVLGKVMPNSQQLLYEIKVIKALNECDAGSVSLQDKLTQVADIKQQELNKVYANAVFNSKETDVFYSFSNGYLPLSENRSGFQSLRISLDKLAKLGEMIGENQTAVSILESNILDDFESHFKVIHDSEYAGRLLLSLLILTDHLTLIADKLSVLETNPAFCRGPMVFLKQQFKTHYIEGIQPYMARVNRTAYDVLASLSKIERNASSSSTDLALFLQQFSMEKESEIWELYQVSAQQHAAQWNRLLRGCHLF